MEDIEDHNDARMVNNTPQNLQACAQQLKEYCAQMQILGHQTFKKNLVFSRVDDS